MREGLRKLPIDRDPHTEVVPNMVELTTPPRVLTLEQRFPFVDDSDEKQNRESQDRQLSANGHMWVLYMYVIVNPFGAGGRQLDLSVSWTKNFKLRSWMDQLIHLFIYYSWNKGWIYAWFNYL